MTNAERIWSEYKSYLRGELDPRRVEYLENGKGWQSQEWVWAKQAARERKQQAIKDIDKIMLVNEDTDDVNS